MGAEKVKDLESRYLTEVEVARILRVSPLTLRKNRCIGRYHPPYQKWGATVLYPKRDFEIWLERQPLHREYVKSGKRKAKATHEPTGK